jgi:hypothetical protein
METSGGSNGWYAQYALAFLSAKVAGMSDIAAHNAARAVADQGRPEAGSAEFKQIFDKIRKIPISREVVCLLIKRICIISKANIT